MYHLVRKQKLAEFAVEISPLRLDRIGDFIRPTVALGRAAQVPDQVAETGMELGDGQRAERKFRPAPVGRLPDQPMVDKIEHNLDTERAVRDQGSG